MAQPGCCASAESPNAALIEMAMAFTRSRVVCAAARLGVADALGDEVRDVEFVSETCQTDADALYRLLRVLASLGLTEETAPKQFRLTPLGRPLRKDAPQSAWPFVVFYGDLLADFWDWLPECIRTGKTATEVRDPNVPSRWAREPNAASIFRAVMGTVAVEEYAPIAAAWDFSHASVVADLGGGGGSLLLAVLKLNPHLRGMLVDREATIEAAHARFAEEDPSSRCKLIVADLTQSVPSGADVYMLKNVLHGSKDEEAIAILKNCRAVVPPSGTVLIIEFILPRLVSQADPQLEGRLTADLGMLAITGGRERSEPEWQGLLEAAGFQLARAYMVGCDSVMVRNTGILEARPAQG
jgi:O-methyltransferase domain/Dimerisation domain